MSTQLKKGFTLIELMVVIVIIGILAAIAIPKLFGMTARAKAQEVGPAAGTWIKMQQAFYMESGKFGDFPTISYVPPGQVEAGNKNKSKSVYFDYLGTGPTSEEIENEDNTKTTVNHPATWNAKNFAALGNGCNEEMWDGTLKFGGDAGKTDSEGELPALTPPQAPCKDLTPNFIKLGK